MAEVRSYISESYESVFLFVIHLLCSVVHGLSFKESFETKPFVSIWNAPSLKCETKFGVNLNLSYFDIVANSGDHFEGNEVVIFYKNELGRYPWIREDGTFINGGLPQLADLSSHLKQVADDLNSLVPNVSFSGLAVIDWESWRPIFERNAYNDVMKVYVLESENLVRKRHPDWTDHQIRTEARSEFENAARRFMQTTLSVCRHLRPNGYWGFYGFPDCYNYKPGQRICSDATQSLNDNLWWMFNTSTALLPSIYLSEDMGSHEDRHDRVYGGLWETLRVNKRYGEPYKPSISYTRFRYGDTKNFYDQTDLNSTVRQVADAGFNGVALWDSSASFETRDQCEAMKEYLDSTLGPFVKAVSENVTKCSRDLCHGHGRCVVKSPSVKNLKFCAKIFKLLEFMYAKIFNAFSEYTYFGQNMIQHEIHSDYDENGHHCMCYKGWQGQNCEIKL